MVSYSDGQNERFDGTKIPPETKAKNPRLTRQERRRLITDEAIKFFSEVGFGGETRELAKRLGITQPHLYKFFPSKDAIIESVFEAVYLRPWNPAWELTLEDSQRPLEDRLKEFYLDYSHVILESEWVRLFLYSGLIGADLNQRYWTIINERIFTRIVRAMRQEFDLPNALDTPPTEIELEAIWNLHASIFYVGVRRWVYQLKVPVDLDTFVDQKVEAFLHGAPALLRSRASSERKVTKKTRKEARAA